MLVPSRSVILESLQYGDAAGGAYNDATYMFDTVTERSTVSLDMQVTAVERTREVELFGMLEMHLRRLVDAAELQRSIQCLARLPPLEINPYRPPRGAHLRLQLDHMRSVEWAELTRKELTVWGAAPPVAGPSGRRLSRPSTAELRRPPSADLLRRGDSFDRAPAGLDDSLQVVGQQITGLRGQLLPIESPLGGYVEEVVAEHYSSGAESDEMIAVDWEESEKTAHTHHHAGRNVGLPPVEPVACLIEEVTALVFRPLWEHQIVPQIVASVKQTAPSQRAQRRKEKEKKAGHGRGHVEQQPVASGSFINAFVLEQQQALASSSPPQRICTPVTGDKSPALPQLSRSNGVPHHGEAQPALATPPDRALAHPGQVRPGRVVINGSRRNEATRKPTAGTGGDEVRRSLSNNRRQTDESATPEPSGKSNRRSVRKPLVVDDDLVIVGLSNGKDPASGYLPRLVDTKAQQQLARAQTANPRNHGVMPSKRVQNT